MYCYMCDNKRMRLTVIMNNTNHSVIDQSYENLGLTLSGPEFVWLPYGGILLKLIPNQIISVNYVYMCAYIVYP